MNVAGLQPGWSRLCSRVAALASLALALNALRVRGVGYAVLAIAISLAYESNCHVVPAALRLLAIAMEAIGLLALVGLVVMVALFAEAGHRGYEYMSVPLWLLLGALFLTGVVAIVGALRTLRS